MNSTLLLGMPGGAEWIVILVAFLIPLLCILDIMRSEFRNPDMRWVWCAVVVFFPLVGSLLYYWIGTEQKVISKS